MSSPFQGQVILEEVAVRFSKEEWAMLDQGQRILHREVMEENWVNLVSLGTASSIPCLGGPRSHCPQYTGVAEK